MHVYIHMTRDQISFGTNDKTLTFFLLTSFEMGKSGGKKVSIHSRGSAFFITFIYKPIWRRPPDPIETNCEYLWYKVMITIQNQIKRQKQKEKSVVVGGGDGGGGDDIESQDQNIACIKFIW